MESDLRYCKTSQEYNTKDARRRFDEVIGKVKDQAQQKTNEERKGTHEDEVEKLVESAEDGGKESHGTNKLTPRRGGL